MSSLPFGFAFKVGNKGKVPMSTLCVRRRTTKVALCGFLSAGMSGGNKDFNDGLDSTTSTSGGEHP